MGWSFTYSNVQCHIKPLSQDKATGLMSVLKKYFPELNSPQVLTIGDSPNDEAMFNPDLFPISVGVANVRHYQDQMLHLPKYLTQDSEFAGFSELAKQLQFSDRLSSTAIYAPVAMLHKLLLLNTSKSPHSKHFERPDFLHLAKFLAPQIFSRRGLMHQTQQVRRQGEIILFLRTK